MKNFIDEFKGTVTKVVNTEYRDSIAKTKEDIADVEKQLETVKEDRRTAIKEGRVEDAITLQERIDKLKKMKEMFESYINEAEYIPPMTKEQYNSFIQELREHYGTEIKKAYEELQKKVAEASEIQKSINELIHEADVAKAFVYGKAEGEYSDCILFRPNAIITDVLQSKSSRSFLTMIDNEIKLMS
jgi:F0F1-type ATP synthase alpha subunit